ncbi:hypothetical protein KAU19_03715 [Candidatus Parcubacteria bacterium]|nr:hypothetical protein [Candidatus Parcubacteria bacterium]
MNKIGNIKVVLDGRGALTLRPNDHKATGGEGLIFKAANTAIKIYKDLKKVAWNNISGKLSFFRSNQHPYVVAPQGLVLSPSGKTIGYYMEYVDGEPIARVFTNAFWKRTGFSNQNVLSLADRMREIVMFAHKRDTLLIDANELGYFVIFNKNKDPEPRIIDVDSWVIGNNWPPKVPIMPSIRDWHTKGWNKGTDWFAWGIVSFQVYTGIHPYKGRLNGFKPSDLEKRMKANASVFAQGIKLNQAVRDFSAINGPLLDWYVTTFQHGNRTVPPSPFKTGAGIAQAARVMRAAVTITGMLIFDKLYDNAGDQAIRIFPCGAVLLDSGKIVNISTKQQIGTALSRNCEAVKAQNGWLKADINGRKIQFYYVNATSLKEEVLTLNINGHKIVSYENRIFAVTDKGLTEITLKVLGKPIISVGQTWGVMVNSTRWFDGVGIQDAMGAMYVIAPFGNNACAQIRIRELDGLQPIMAKAGNRFIAVIGMDSSGVYHKVELTFDRGYDSYKAWQGKTDSPDLNIAILPKGVCATIVNDGELAIFVPTAGALNKVQDKHISTGMMLANWNNKVVYIHNGDVWSVRMAGK